MKVKLVSDLHLELCEDGNGVPDLGEGEVLILGGDILCARHLKKDGKLKKVYEDFLQKCSDNFKAVFYICGNHEYYGYNYESTKEVLKECLPPKVCFIDNTPIFYDDWAFFGTTLWTDFNKNNPMDMLEASRCMNDYHTIRIGSNYRKLRPEDTYGFHLESMKALTDFVECNPKENIWVFTHHGPSYQSVHMKYRSEPLNSAFVTDLDEFILAHPQIKVFSHGHTHCSFDYKIGECRIICNPRGYYNGYNTSGLNPDFDPNFEVEL